MEDKPITTIHDLNMDSRVFLTPSDIADILGIEKNVLINQVKTQPDTLQFPVIVIGEQILIPRKRFLAFLGYDMYTDESDVFYIPSTEQKD